MPTIDETTQLNIDLKRLILKVNDRKLNFPYVSTKDEEIRKGWVILDKLSSRLRIKLYFDFDYFGNLVVLKKE